MIPLTLLTRVFAITLKTVSYTHLDVYKRQVSYSFGADIDSGLALSVTAYAVPPPPKWEALTKPQSLLFRQRLALLGSC